MKKVGNCIKSAGNVRMEDSGCTNEELCTISQGFYCCQNCGCVWSPDDFDAFTNPNATDDEKLQFVIKILSDGMAAIDHRRVLDKSWGAFSWESIYSMNDYGEIRKLRISKERLDKKDGILYLRAPNIGRGPVDVIHSERYLGPDQGCALWTKEGCTLLYNQRPKGGREMIPKPDYDCEEGYPEWQAVLDWQHHQNILYQAYEFFMRKEDEKNE